MKPELRERMLQVLKDNLGEIDFSYYKSIHRIESLADILIEHTETRDSLLNLCSGAFLLECILEDRGYAHLTAVDADARLASLYESLMKAGLLTNTSYHEKEITKFASKEAFNFITLYDCAYYPGNDLIEMLPQLNGLLERGGHMLFDVYDISTYKYIKPFYDLVRKKYRNRVMYDLDELAAALDRNHFEIIETKIELGKKTILVKIALSAVFFITRRALVVRYLVRKKAG